MTGRRRSREGRAATTTTTPKAAQQQQEDMRVVLSEDPALGSWWEDKPGSVRAHEPGYPLRTEWESRIKRRITQIIAQVVTLKKKPEWLTVTNWEKLKKRPIENPEFAKTSEINKVNRRSGSKDGKALATHTLGRKNAVLAFKELGAEATPYKLMEKSKKDKHGNWINPRAEETDVGYRRLMNQPMPEGLEPDPNESYYTASGGYNEKMRVWGMGSAAPELYDPPANRLARHSVSSYSPSLLSRVTMENSQLRQQIGRMEGEMMTQKYKGDSMEAFLFEKYGWTPPPPPTCSGGPPPFRRDDFTDDGHPFGSQHVTPIR
ncbi:uncharacterized protein LOC141649161 [Silene latifolia]|uniref:uncharacterized protein LOC141649161 n=1 Tax=Silene latifolia TaxID=37657 RepID=UPI003D77CE8D